MPAPAIAILHEQTAPPGIAVGREVAVRQQLLALGQHGRHYRYRLFCPSRQRTAIASGFALEPRLEVADRTELRGIDALDIAAWHETQLDLFTPFAIRERAHRSFPVTVLHHTISYKELLHDAFLRLLLAETHPYDTIICTSSAARQALEQIVRHVADRFNARHATALGYGGRFEEIPLGVDTERFRPLDRAGSRRRLELEPDAFVLLWIGRLSPIDKADLLPLVEAFVELVARHPDRKLLLVCAGAQRPGERFGDVLIDYARQAGIGDAVRVLSESAEFEPWMAHLYSCADVFVSPVDNVQETFGLTPAEAMACGVPQVVSDWNGYRDTVVEGETGFRIPTLWAAEQAEIDDLALLSETAFDHLALASGVAVDMRALVAAIDRLITNEDLRRSMSRASRRRAVERFSWSVIVARYERLWRELIEQAQREPVAASPPPTYALPRYGAFFAGYATRLLTPDNLLTLTSKGRDLIAGGAAEVPTHYNVEFGYLDLGMLRRILGGLAHFAERDEPLEVRRALATLSRGQTGAADRDLVLRHILWLCKYGFAEVR